MQYLLLIFDDQDELAKLDAAARARIMADYLAFTADIRRSGHFRGGNALEPVTTATTIRVRRGKRVMVDGACAETREQLAGYYLVEAPDLDAAIGWAKKIPGGPNYAVEVRPVWPVG